MWPYLTLLLSRTFPLSHPSLPFTLLPNQLLRCRTEMRRNEFFNQDTILSLPISISPSHTIFPFYISLPHISFLISHPAPLLHFLCLPLTYSLSISPSHLLSSYPFFLHLFQVLYCTLFLSPPSFILLYLPSFSHLPNLL